MTVAWTAERTQLAQLIREQDAALAELYVFAIDLLLAGPITRGRLAVVSHCLRELTGALPHVLQDEGIEERANVDRPAKELAAAWHAARLPLTDVVDQEDADEVRAIPTSVFVAAQAVAITGSTASGNAWRRTAIMATGQPATSDSAVIDRLHDAVDWFASKWVHVRDYSKPDRPLPDQAELELRLSIIEQALLTRLSNMLDRARTVRDLLDRANKRASDDNE